MKNYKKTHWVDHDKITAEKQAELDKKNHIPDVKKMVKKGVRKMILFDRTHQFMDNSIAEKQKKIVVFHWTGCRKAKTAMEWLDKRLEGKGSVGYNYIIDVSGDIFMLANPCSRWMHNTGLGTDFDKRTISIAFAAIDADEIGKTQLRAAKELVAHLQHDFECTYTHHAALNDKKPDFPNEFWEKVKKFLEI